MYAFYPIIVIGGIIGFFSVAFLIAYFCMKDKKEAIGFDRHMKDSVLIKRMLPFAKPHTVSLIVIFLFLLLSVGHDVLSPILVGAVEELIKEDFALKRLYLIVALYALSAVLSVVCTYVSRILLQKTGQRIISDVRERLFTHIESLSHNQLHHIPVGTLVTRVMNDTGAISRMFTNILTELCRDVFILVGVLCAMFALNAELTVITLCFLPFIVLFTLIFRKFTRRAHRRVKDGTTNINIFLSENLSGMKITQIFNREERKMREFEERNDALAKAKSEEILVFGIFRPLVYMLYLASVLCLFYFAGRGVIAPFTIMKTVVSAGTVVTFYLYIKKFFTPVQSLAEQFHRLQASFASAEKIFSILDIQPEVVDEEDAVDIDKIEGDIEFSHVTFGYVEGHDILKDVSFRIKAGQTAAFVGATGAGKTTILSLLCRNYDVDRGEIYIDGIPIKHIKMASLRRHMGQMLQDVFLFAGTIRSNITLREDFSDEEVMAACRYVNADGMIEKLEHGLDEEVRERGNNFSAGERQLLSFARTIIHKPDVMILDEATANIDTETEKLIQDSLSKMMNIGTMLIVAHRLSTIKSCDRIFVLSHGEIVEEGNHEELLKKHGRYYDLYKLQSHAEKLKKV